MHDTLSLSLSACKCECLYRHYTLADWLTWLSVLCEHTIRLKTKMVTLTLWLRSHLNSSFILCFHSYPERVVAYRIWQLYAFNSTIYCSYARTRISIGDEQERESNENTHTHTRTQVSNPIWILYQTVCDPIFCTIFCPSLAWFSLRFQLVMPSRQQKTLVNMNFSVLFD